MKAIELATRVALELGAGWFARAAEERDNYAFIHGPDGEQISLTIGGYQQRGRVVLRMSVDHEQWQHVHTYSEKIPEITVAETKSPAQIARDVERRLLPSLRDLLASIRERKARHDDAESARDTLTSALRELLGPGTQHLTHNGLNELRSGRYGDTLDATVKVGYGARDVTFEIRTSSREAAEVIAVAIASARSAEQ